MKKTALFAAITFILVSVFSCREAEEEETTPGTMSGTVRYDIPYYVLRGETVTMSASGVSYPGDVAYKWYISGVYTDTLASNVITVRFPDSLGVFTVTAVSYAPGFYSNSTSRSVSTIDTSYNASLTGVPRSDSFIVDKRDGQSYGYVTIGDYDWFSRNLAWAGAGVPYKESPSTATLFGYFYTWNEACAGACPEGWHLPGREEWENMASVLNGGAALPFIDNWNGLGSRLSVDASFNGTRMWPYSPDNAHANVAGWNALPLGTSTNDGTKFSGDNAYGYWWTASEKNVNQAYYRYIHYDQDAAPAAFAGKDDIRLNVRCVRKHQQSL